MKIICWDFDGTLAYSDSLWSNSVLTALNLTDSNHGIKIDDIRKHMSTGFTWHTPEEDFHTLVGEKWWDYMNSRFSKIYLLLGVSPDIAEKACHKIRGIVKRKENYSLYCDAADALAEVKEKGCKNVLLSNNYPDLAEVVELLGLSCFFDSFVVSSAVGYDKPRKEIFEFTKALYPESCDFFIIGDSVKADIEGGKNAGMKTVLVHKGHSDAADYCFDELKSICGLL